jgi:hypothetical protein
LVYGEHRLHECFAILDLRHALGLAAQIKAIKACTTVGKARRLQPTLEFIWIPGGDFEDDEDELVPDDAPYAWEETASVGDGDRPPMPDALALDHLPAELLRKLAEEAGAEKLETVFNGPLLAIELDREADLRNVARSVGYQVHRDDTLIASIGAEM